MAPAAAAAWWLWQQHNCLFIREAADLHSLSKVEADCQMQNLIFFYGQLLICATDSISNIDEGLTGVNMTDSFAAICQTRN